MNHLLRLFVVSGLSVFAILVIAIELTRHGVDLLTPSHLILFVVGMAIYLLSTALALYRNCEKTVWIAAINVFLGWPIFGWVISLGSAVDDKIGMLHPTMPRPHRHALLRH